MSLIKHRVQAKHRYGIPSVPTECRYTLFACPLGWVLWESAGVDINESIVQLPHSHFCLNSPLLTKSSARRHARSETLFSGFGGYAVPKISR